MLTVPHLGLSRRKKYMIAIIFFIAMAICTGLGLYIYNKSTTQTEINTTRTEQNTNPTDLIVNPAYDDPSAKQQGVKGVETSEETPSAAAFPTTQPNLRVTIDSASQRGQTIIVSATIAPEAKGSCIIELSRLDQQPLSQEIPLKEKVCSTALETSTLPKGLWTITVKAIVSDNVATASLPITIK